MAPESEPQYLHTSDGSYPLHEYHLALAGREWIVLHTGVILTFEDEVRFFKEMLGLPYGVALWPSAIALAYEIASRGADAFGGRRVLELGAGTGLPGIVAASLGAEVVQTDRQELAMTVCARNCEQNGIVGIERRLVDWNEWADTTRYDWIIGSDILYADTMHEALRHIFHTNLAPGGRMLVADPFRGASLRFLESLMEKGWDITITKWNLGDTDKPRTIGLFELEHTDVAT